VARKRIPFIACEFEVFEAAQAIALAAKQEEAKVGWGLMRLWRRCWEAKTDVVHEGMIEGYVPGCLEQLIIFGFVERWEHRQIRIKGLDRYIRVKKSKKGDSVPVQVPFVNEGGTSGPPSPLKSDETGGKIEDRRSKTDLKDLSFPFLDEQPKARKLSEWEELWADMTEERIARLEVLNVQGPDRFEVTPERLSAREVNALLSELAEAVEELAGESFSEASTEISGAWRHFLIDNWGKKLKPEPFTLRAFCSPKVWPRHWRAYNETALGGVG